MHTVTAGKISCNDHRRRPGDVIKTLSVAGIDRAVSSAQEFQPPNYSSKLLCRVWSQVGRSRLPASACKQSSRSPTHHKSLLLYLYPRMSTPNPYSHPSFFPTHAIVRKKSPPRPPSRLLLTDVYHWDDDDDVVVVGTAVASARL